MSGEERLPPSQNDLEALLDPKGQKGVQWRMQKLAAIRKLVKSGKTKAWVVWFLRTRTGLTLQTARGLVEDAFLEEPKGGIEDMAGVSFNIVPKGAYDRLTWKFCSTLASCKLQGIDSLASWEKGDTHCLESTYTTPASLPDCRKMFLSPSSPRGLVEAVILWEFGRECTGGTGVDACHAKDAL